MEKMVVHNDGSVRCVYSTKRYGDVKKDIDTINNSDIYDTYKDLYLSEKEREENLLQGILSANGLKARMGSKKSDGTALTVTM